MKLSGLVLIRNGLELDYCFIESIKSLLPVCDEIIVCDGESTDGTQQTIRDWMKVEPKIKLCIYPWPDPKGQIDFYVDWIQFGRGHAKGSHVLHLDADELLGDESYNAILEFKKQPVRRVSWWFSRLNFWRDEKHLIPHGECCSHRVVRLSPQDVFLPSDGPHEKGAECIGMAVESPCVIYHYGFLRRKEAFFLKARELQKMFFNSYDERLAAVERKLILEGENAKGNWMSEIENLDWKDRLIPFVGTHAAIAIPWLRERGYNV